MENRDNSHDKFSESAGIDFQLPLRKPYSYIYVIKIMIFIVFPAVMLAVWLGNINRLLSIASVWIITGFFIGSLIKLNKNRGGYDLEIKTGKLFIYTIGAGTLLFEEKLSDIVTSIYQIQIPNKYSRQSFEVLKIRLLQGKVITFAQYLGTNRINRKQSFFEDILYSFQHPEFMLDKVSFGELCSVFGLESTPV